MPEICLFACCHESAALFSLSPIVQYETGFAHKFVVFILSCSFVVSYQLNTSLVKLSDQLLTSTLWLVSSYVKVRAAGCCAEGKKCSRSVNARMVPRVHEDTGSNLDTPTPNFEGKPFLQLEVGCKGILLVFFMRQLLGFAHLYFILG